MKGRSLQRV